jgi:hypothetical protein
MSRFHILPKKGHPKAVERILSYLKTFPKREGYHWHFISWPFCIPCWEILKLDGILSRCWRRNHKGSSSWKRAIVRMTVYVEADHVHDLFTRKLITGILVIINNMHIRWISKHQKTVETSTYGSWLVASRIATNLILEVRNILRSLRVALDGTALMLGDNMSLVWILKFSIFLKKKHDAIA